MGAIRANGLGHYWSDQPSTAWYTISEQGTPMGWRLEYRIPIEGGFAGVSVTGIATRQGIVVPVASRWQLSNDLNTGKYQSFVLHEDGRIITEIELSQEQVKVRRGVLIGVTAEAWQPWRQFPLSQTEGNYVPEGALWLVIAQVAALRAEGGFSLIFDEEADMRQTFLRYAGEVAQDGKRFAKVLGSSMVMGRKSAEEYLLSEEGVVFQIGADREAQAMSDYASILKQFGDPLPMVQPWLWPDMRGSPQIPDAGGAIGDSDR
jgi:hypothetical protein